VVVMIPLIEVAKTYLPKSNSFFTHTFSTRKENNRYFLIKNIQQPILKTRRQSEHRSGASMKYSNEK